MSKRFAAWSIGCIVVVAVAVTVWLIVRNTTETDEARFDRIRVGMTLSDVEHIMGGASYDSRYFPEPGEDDFGPSINTYPAAYRFPDNTTGVVHQWPMSKAYIYVMFGSDNRVREKQLVQKLIFLPKESDLWDRIASWFR